MELAVKIYWFYRDNCCTVGTIKQIKSQLNNTEFVNELLNDMFNLTAHCQKDIAKLGNPNDLEGFDQTIYNDLVELHNRAVELYNALVERMFQII